MKLGFSYIGLIWLVMLFVPNFIWMKNKPKDYEEYAKKENKVLLAFERVGPTLAALPVATARVANCGKPSCVAKSLNVLFSGRMSR